MCYVVCSRNKQEVGARLAQAAHAVAGPSQRSMGTLGGNVCLDTRCVWYNQTHFWRKSLGYCLDRQGAETAQTVAAKFGASTTRSTRS